MKKIDYKKELYNPSKKEIVSVNVPKMNFLMVDGKGNPNTAQEFKDAIEALYAVAYTLKFAIKKSKNFDYVVPPLEALWWSDNMDDFTTGNKDSWQWTAMIMQPEAVAEIDVKEAINAVEKKKNPVALSKLRFEAYEEGESAHILYFGSYADEGPIIQRIHEFIEEQGKKRSGKHHEIYLSDARRVAPEKLKTIIRQPMS